MKAVQADITTFNNIEFARRQSKKEADTFVDLVGKGMSERYGQIPDAVMAQANREIETILSSNCASLFIAAHDIVAFAKENNIPVGPGRGSAPASLVNYALGITNIDPLPFGLVFELFFAPEHEVSITLDIGSAGQSQVLRHAAEQYAPIAEGERAFSLKLLAWDILDKLQLMQEILPETKAIDRLADPNTFALLKQGNTEGIMMLEWNTSFLPSPRFEFNNFDDIAVFIALATPANREVLAEYDKRRNSWREDKVALHPCTANILKDTYGLLLFLEQIVKILNECSGFGLSEGASVCRSIFSNKNGKMEKERKNSFVEACINNGIPRKESHAIWAMMVSRTPYYRLKSHAVAYGILAYQMAYFKAHAPKYFHEITTDNCEMCESSQL